MLLHVNPPPSCGEVYRGPLRERRRRVDVAGGDGQGRAVTMPTFAFDTALGTCGRSDNDGGIDRA